MYNSQRGAKSGRKEAKKWLKACRVWGRRCKLARVCDGSVV